MRCGLIIHFQLFIMGFYIPETTMSKDPAFLFYPGDYLRDTQMLSETVQVSYDRIMCEHMRNICISQQQLKFLTKRLNKDEKDELLSVITKVDGGYQITWVAESILKRRAYSDSRRKNREGKTANISESYDNHMEDAIVIENDNGNNKEDITKIEKLFISTWQRKPKNLSEILAVEKMFVEYSEKHIIQAFRRAAEQDVITVAYVKGILKKHYEKMASDKVVKEAKKKKLEMLGVKV